MAWRVARCVFHRQRVSGVGISRSSQTRQRSLAPFVVSLPGDVFETRDRCLFHRESRIDEAGAVAFTKNLSRERCGRLALANFNHRGNSGNDVVSSLQVCSDEWPPVCAPGNIAPLRWCKRSLAPCHFAPSERIGGSAGGHYCMYEAEANHPPQTPPAASLGPHHEDRVSGHGYEDDRRQAQIGSRREARSA